MKLKRLALVFAGVIVGLLLSELTTRLAESKLERVQLSGAWFGQVQTVPDPNLGLRIVPNSPGHDANGFRNVAVPGDVDIVAIGDSQTWGQNASMDDAWPQKLGQLSGMVVYNMGVNGYGPIEYQFLIEQAVSLKPKVVVVGLYFGNDLWDAYHAVYSRDAFARLRKPDLVNTLSTDVVSEKVDNIVEQTSQLCENFRKNSTWTWVEWLGHNTAIGRQLSSRGRWPGQTSSAKNAALRKAMVQFPAYGVVYDGKHNHTILTTSYRLAALDRNEIRIIEGLRITKLAISRIKEATDRHGAKLVVLLIPTKELVFAEQSRSLGKVDSTYETLVQMETASRNEIEEYSRAQGIEVVDALGDLANAVTSEQQIYPESADGHPTAAGYRVIAQSVKAKLFKQP